MTIDELSIAILWLNSNEGEKEEKESCEKVAIFLEKYRQNMVIKKIAKERKLPVRFIKDLIKRSS